MRLLPAVSLVPHWLLAHEPAPEACANSRCAYVQAVPVHAT